MNKDIKFIPVDSALEDWLIEQLSALPPKSESAADLLLGLKQLKDGEAGCLLLGVTEQQPQPVQQNRGELHLGELQISLKSRRVLMGENEVSLTPKEFDILYFLAENRGEVFTKEQIYNAVWSDEYMLDASNIMAFIRKLRKKIEPDPDAPKYILTIWGIGYKFNDQL